MALPLRVISTRLRASRARRHLEDERGFERALSRLWPWARMDAYDGYVAYRMLDEQALAPEIAEMRDLMERDWRTLDIDQDLGLGMMLWLAHFFPDEPWAKAQTKRAFATLDTMWIDPPGYFCRAPGLPESQVCLHELWRFVRLAGGGCLARRVSSASTPSSRTGAQAMNTTARRSPG